MSNKITDIIVEMSLDSWQDDEVGSTTEAPFEWAAMFYFSPADATGPLEGLAGAILFCDSNGFYSSIIFKNRENLAHEWEIVVEELTIDGEE